MRVEGWTEARYFSFLRSALRRAWTKYPNKYKTLNAAKRRKLGARGKQKYEYECAECKHYYANKNVQVDHMDSAGSLRSFDDLPAFVSRLFCAVEGLQVLCFKCHTAKTNEERGIIPEISEFKNSNAEEQKTKLKKLGLDVGSNAVKRLGTFIEWYAKKQQPPVSHPKNIEERQMEPMYEVTDEDNIPQELRLAKLLELTVYVDTAIGWIKVDGYDYKVGCLYKIG